MSRYAERSHKSEKKRLFIPFQMNISYTAVLLGEKLLTTNKT